MFCNSYEPPLYLRYTSVILPMYLLYTSSLLPLYFPEKIQG